MIARLEQLAKELEENGFKEDVTLLRQSIRSMAVTAKGVIVLVRGALLLLSIALAVLVPLIVWAMLVILPR